MARPGRPFGTVKTGLKFLDDSQLKKFFIAVDKSKDRCDQFLFRIILFAGLRVSECANLKLKDLNLDSYEISIQGMKNGRRKTYNLDGRLFFKLEKWLKERKRIAGKKNEFLFPSTRYHDEHVSTQMIKNRFKKYVELAGLNSDFSIHSLRHSCGILHARNGESPISIMLWLRHRNINSTQIYFEQLQDEELNSRAKESFQAYL